MNKSTYIIFSVITTIAIVINLIIARKINSQIMEVKNGKPPDTFLFSIESLAAISWLSACVFGSIAGISLLNTQLNLIFSSVSLWKALSAMVPMALTFPQSIEKIVGLPRNNKALPYIYLGLYGLIIIIILFIGSQSVNKI